MGWGNVDMFTVCGCEQASAGLPKVYRTLFLAVVAIFLTIYGCPGVWGM